MFVDETKCDGCGDCQWFCPSGGMSIKGDMAVIDQPVCFCCGNCLRICPINAIYEARVPAEGIPGILKGVSRRRASLLPVLQQVQARLGYLSGKAMLEVAEFLGVPEMDVYSVATFYNQFRLTAPGKHSVRVCLGTACHMKGGYIILDAWERRLGINPGKTTPDREFDLDTVACVGCCAMAPVTIVDDAVQGRISPTRVDGILLSFQLEKEKEGKENQ